MKTNNIFKLSLLLFLLSMITQQSYACGGCIDSPLGSTMANEGKSFYNQGEEAVFRSIEELNKLLETEIKNAELKALKENSILLSLEQNNNQKTKQENFLLKQQNYIQSIINEIKGVR